MDGKLVTSGLAFGYSKSNPVLSGIRASFPAGMVTAVIGINGSGKSTLLKLLTGIERPDQGEISLCTPDQKMTVAAYRSVLGFMPERLDLRPEFSVRHTLDFYARLKRISLDKVDAVLQTIGLEGASGAAVGTLSKGMRQRLNLGQALLNDPQILIFDEPSNGFDAFGIQDFYRTIRRASDNGAIVILATHQLEEVAGHIDRVVILARGSVLQEGDVESVLWQRAADARMTWISWNEPFLPIDIGLDADTAGKLAIRDKVWVGNLTGNDISVIISLAHQEEKAVSSLRTDWLDMARILEETS